MFATFLILIGILVIVGEGVVEDIGYVCKIA